MYKRVALALLCGFALAGCRDYHGYGRVASEKGLIPADQWAAYGHEQAQAVAIGREFAAAYYADTPEALAGQISRAVEYATSLGLDVVVADTLGHRVTVQFPSGWRLAILPIDDGKRPADASGAGAANQ